MHGLRDFTRSIRQSTTGRWLCVAMIVSMCLPGLGGCNRLRLPAVDPTGSCLFQPLPTTTGLALPGTAGEGCRCLGCLSGIGDCFRNTLAFTPPEPAFTTPVDPPPCLEPAAPPVGVVVPGEPCVPGPACNGSCVNGPPAVLLGDECRMSDLAHLPNQGKRGCILLSPQRIVAPVNGEVILLSGICGTDGYLQTGEPLEWMLTPESVGTFLQVADEPPGLMHKLVGIQRPKKQDPSFARGVTSTKSSLITRGNLDPRDDVKLQAGQTWLSLSSPTEGVSRVTVLAPESDCWDQRKATATIYWIDARWEFPPSQTVPQGVEVPLTTRVTRSEGSIPAVGWKVRYEILNPELARFAGTNGSPIVEVEVDEQGNATANVLPIEGTAGTTAIDIQVIRPGGRDDNMPTMTLGRGQTFVTWSAPQLRVEAFGPQVAGYAVPYLVKAILSNPGNQPVTNVAVDLEFPPGVDGATDDSFASVFERRIRWDIPELPPQTELEIFAEVTATNSHSLTFVARGEPGLAMQDSIRTEVYQPSLTVDVRPQQTNVEAGETVAFEIDVTNTGDRVLEDVRLRVIGDDSMRHLETGDATVESFKEEDEINPGPLQPGEVWASIVRMVPLESGRRCITVEATASGGQKATTEQCITARNVAPPTPAMSVTLESNETFTVGETRYFNGRVTNTGDIPLQNVRAVMTFDPQLQLQSATQPGLDQSLIGQYQIAWDLPRLEPNQTTLLQGVFAVITPTPRCTVTFIANSDQGARGEDSRVVQILPAATAPPPPIDSPSDLPPSEPPPRIPTGPAPGGDFGGVDPGESIPVPPTPARPDRLKLNLFQRDISPRVNDPIRYTLEVFNDSETSDRNVTLEIPKPQGVFMDSLVQRENPQSGITRTFGERILIEPIRQILPGETVTYELIMRSTVPQRFELAVEATSDRRPDGLRTTVTTEVTP